MNGTGNEKIKLMPHQEKILADTRGKKHVGYFLDMGLGKTFVAAEHARELGTDILVIAPKSVIPMWIEHFAKYYPEYTAFNLTTPRGLEKFLSHTGTLKIGAINYDLIHRRPQLYKIEGYTMILDESSMVKNYKSKRTRSVMFYLKPENIILASGTICGGKYEDLWTQAILLGWKISRKKFIDTYCIVSKQYIGANKTIDVVVGYKNVEDLFRRMRESGGVFLKTDQVLDLPEQIHTIIECKRTKDYENLKKNRICTTDTPAGEIELIGDSVMALMIGLRKLAGAYNPSKSQALDDLIESTDGRMVVFYNFNAELNVIINAATKANRPIAVINGEHHDTKLYEDIDNCILAVQYQAGSMGLNLQQGHVIVYFAPTQSFDQFDQSKKRIHRIGQTRTCMYYYLVAEGTIEVNIYKTLEKREDYTLKLFEDDLEK